ncbi:hypothetical protein BD770DRAFT_387042 [Pilaira anomala]|nr:hypothetical protein BD770DRAFT_387042 [Pilaira anomala]
MLANHAPVVAQYQPQVQPQYQPYQPQTNQEYQNEVPVMENHSTTIIPAIVTTGAVAGGGAGAAAAAALPSTPTPTPNNNSGLLAPTQAGSVGVFQVAATYTPTLSDEIDIQTGDQVEVLVEYDDGWCQGINLSRGNAKGVFPKHCIDYASNTSGDRVKRVSSMYIA